MEKQFSINEKGFSVRCLMYCDNPVPGTSVVVCGHGFGGHKENAAVARFAKRLLKKNKAVVLAFDWPCHGEDSRKKLILEECDLYLTLVLNWAQKRFGIDRRQLFAYATSFGGYLFLKYMAEHGNPFARSVFRCPAVDMAKALEESIMSPDQNVLLKSGKPVLAGFDRKISISLPFLKQLQEADLLQMDFSSMAESILIMHGTKDELIPFESTRHFAQKNGIEFLAVEHADHRFSDPLIMDLTIDQIVTSLGFR